MPWTAILQNTGALAAMSAAFGAAMGGVVALFKWLTARESSNSKEHISDNQHAIARLTADLERFKTEKQVDLEQKRLDVQATNVFQSNLLQQIQLQQNEIAMLRNRCTELEKLHMENTAQIRELEANLNALRQQMASAQIHTLKKT